jgi:hypothetical protein
VATIESTICPPETIKSDSKLLGFVLLSLTGMWSQLILSHESTSHLQWVLLLNQLKSKLQIP